MNKFGRFLGRISAKTFLKMDYFGSKFPKIAKRWGLCPQTPLPPAAPRPPFKLNNWRMCKTLHALNTG